jgi:hypothetical protein
MVFNDDYSSPFIDEPMKNRDELRDIVRVEADRWLLQNVEGRFPAPTGLDLLGSSRGPPGKLRDELDALGFAAAERWTRLAKLQVAEPRLDE